MTCQRLQEVIPALDLNGNLSQSHSRHGTRESGWTSLSPKENISFYIDCLTDLQFPFKFICPFIISECTFFSDEVENLHVFTVVAEGSSNQLSISYHAAYVWPTLRQKIPLAFNNLVHLFLFALRGRETSLYLLYTLWTVKFIFWKSYYLGLSQVPRLRRGTFSSLRC